jgi:hypothetical protein
MRLEAKACCLFALSAPNKYFSIRLVVSLVTLRATQQVKSMCRAPKASEIVVNGVIYGLLEQGQVVGKIISKCFRKIKN